MTIGLGAVPFVPVLGGPSSAVVVCLGGEFLIYGVVAALVGAIAVMCLSGVRSRWPTARNVTSASPAYRYAPARGGATAPIVPHTAAVAR